MMGDAADAAPLGPGMGGGSGTDVLPDVILSQGSAAGPAPPERPTAAPALELNMLANAAASQPAPLPDNSRVRPLTMTTEPAPVSTEGPFHLAFASPHSETGDATGTPRRLGLVFRRIQLRVDAVSVTRAHLEVRDCTPASGSPVAASRPGPGVGCPALVHRTTAPSHPTSPVGPSVDWSASLFSSSTPAAPVEAERTLTTRKAIRKQRVTSKAAARAAATSFMPTPPEAPASRYRKRSSPSAPVRERTETQRSPGGPADGAAETRTMNSDDGRLTLPDGAAKLIQDAVAKAQRDALRPVMTELTAMRSTIVAFKTSLDSLCTTVNPQGEGNERASQALQQLQGTVKGGFSTLLGVVDSVDPIGQCKGKGKAVKKRATAAAASGGSASGASRAGANQVVDEKQALSLKRREAMQNSKTLNKVRDTLKKDLIKLIFYSTSTSSAYPDLAITKRLARASVKTVLKITEAASREYPSSRVLLPVRNAGEEPQHYRV